MKNYLLVVVLACCFTGAYCQTTFHYTYDATGNRTERSINLVYSKSGLVDESSTRQQEIVKDETFLPATILIYPNPTEGLLQIEIIESGEGDSDFTLVVSDINGKQVLRKKKESTRTIIDLSDQPAGFYIFTITLGTVVSRWKVVKL